MQALLERLYARSTIVDDYELIIAIVEAHVLVDDTLKEKQGTIMKLLRMLFGAKTEKKKTDHVVKPNTPKEKSKGHGRYGRASYTGSKKVTVALQKHSRDVFRNPDRWLPWNYETASG